MLTIDQLQREAYQNAAVHGFWDGQPDIGNAIAWIHSEISEAYSAAKTGKPNRYIENGKPEGVAIELADAIILIADLAAYLGADLQAAVEEKLAYNKNRPYMHGKRF